MIQQAGIVGCRIEYDSGGRIYQGVIIDKVRVLPKDSDLGEGYDLYLVDVMGKIFKISPVMIKRIISI